MSRFGPVYLLACAFTAAASGADVRITDSVDAFLVFYDAAKSAPEQEQIRRFRETVYASNPVLYQYRFEDWKSAGRDPDKELIAQIKLFQTYEAAYRSLRKTIRGELDASLASFTRQFPDFKTDFDVYLAHSLGLADGTRRSIGGRDRFVLGLDMIARYHPDDNTAFFHHELQHVYHAQHYRQTRALFSHLWEEGLATYTSEALNPGASLKAILLANDRGSLPEKVDPVLSTLAQRILADLQSEDWQVHLKYFASSSRDPEVPARAGYYIGYLLAKRLSARYPLDRLQRLQDADLVPALKGELQQMSAERR